jgi:hypothetical protein
MNRLMVSCVLIGLPAAAAAEMSTEALLKACREKVQAVEVIEGKPQVVGEKLNELCHGYLVGVYEAMTRSGSICSSAEPATPEYLLSVVQTYVGKGPPAGHPQAVQVTEAAYRRAFPCEPQRKKEWGIK